MSIMHYVVVIATCDFITMKSDENVEIIFCCITRIYHCVIVRCCILVLALAINFVASLVILWYVWCKKIEQSSSEFALCRAVAWSNIGWLGVKNGWMFVVRFDLAWKNVVRNVLFCFVPSCPWLLRSFCTWMITCSLHLYDIHFCNTLS